MQILNQLISTLQAEGATVRCYSGTLDEEGFGPFFRQHLPSCQWFILFQTPSLVSFPEAQPVVNTVLNLMVQQRLEGAVRFIVTPDCSITCIRNESTS